jgi:hypothetical protein
VIELITRVGCRRCQYSITTAEPQSPSAFPPSSFPTGSSISLNSADVVFLAVPLFPLPCAGLNVADRPLPCAELCEITDRPRPLSPDTDPDPPTFAVIPRFPRPVVIVDASDNRPAACGVSAAERTAGLGDPVAVPRLSNGARGEAIRSDVMSRLPSGARGEAIRSDVVSRRSSGARGEAMLSDVVPRRSNGGRGLACDELREVDGLLVNVVLGLRSGSREAVLCVGALPKMAGSMGFVSARWRGGVFGRWVGGVDLDGACVSARWNDGRVLRGRGARGAGVGDVAGSVSRAGMASSLMS